ncbi:hypothetical protein [Morganella morganii]|uniref:hypothetical protein n=1 Tax=Morganella morganii TaxID=582 RepID=UPI00311932B4
MKKFIGKLADFCGGYARLAVIGIVAMFGVIAIIFFTLRSRKNICGDSDSDDVPVCFFGQILDRKVTAT